MLQIVAEEFDHVSSDESAYSTHFETIYALLDNVSPEYRNSFGDALMRKLSQLQQRGEDSEDSEDQRT